MPGFNTIYTSPTPIASGTEGSNGSKAEAPNDVQWTPFTKLKDIDYSDNLCLFAHALKVGLRINNVSNLFVTWDLQFQGTLVRMKM